MMASLEFDLSSIISQIDEPLLLNNLLKWEILSWDLQKWNDVIGNEHLEFRSGWNAKTDNPQWEKSTPSTQGKFEDIMNFTSTDRWLYFDYKYMKDWLLNSSELRENIHFQDLGLKYVTVNESTIWIGTKGAHTPCHIDTYGCNIVVQIYGRKLWLLFEPDEDLKATRVPYEESTIYSRLNFFSPTDLTKFEDVHNGKLIILNPGDVLIIPNKWWHYVESLDKSISINTWLPLQKDHQERKRECLLQVLISSLLNNTDKKTQTTFLNPNSYDLLNPPFIKAAAFLEEILKMEERDEELSESDGVKLMDCLEKNPSISKINTMSDENLKQFLGNQSSRFPERPKSLEEKEENLILKKITHAISHPDVINLILKKILEE